MPIIGVHCPTQPDTPIRVSPFGQERVVEPPPDPADPVIVKASFPVVILPSIIWSPLIELSAILLPLMRPLWKYP